MSLTLCLTHDCNLRCAYCYAGRKRKVAMSPDTMRRAYDSVKLSSGQGKTVATPPPKRPTASFSYVPQTIRELRALGFESIGSVSKDSLPYKIAGDDWNAPDTFYTIRSRVIPGNVLNDKHVEDGMNVWRKSKR